MTQTVDFFRARLDVMRGWPRAIDLRHPLVVLASRLPWSLLDADLAPIWRRESRDGVLPEGEDLFGSGGGVLVAAGVSYAGRARLPIRLMCSLLYLKHAFNLSDEETCERWAENVVWQYFSGMDPFVVPFIPISGTPLARHPSPPSSFMATILKPLGEMLATANLRSRDIKAGCGKCGACSSLSAYES